VNPRRNQRQRILDRLLEARGSEVPSFELSRISLQYGARVKELREAGFRIVNRVEHHDGKVFGFFRLELGPPTSHAGQLKPVTPSDPATIADQVRLPLFENGGQG